MKLKTIAKMAVCAAMIGILAGCGTSDTASSRSVGTSSGVEAVLNEQISQADTKGEGQNAAVIANGDAGETDVKADGNSDVVYTDVAATDQKSDAEETDVRDDEAVDIDLTKLSSTMVYSEVYDMMNVPQDYIGKVVKMNGKLTTVNGNQVRPAFRLTSLHL